MKKLLWFILGIWLLTGDLPVRAAPEDCNPQPAAEDLILPGPDGTCFVFRPVYVEGENAFGGSTFIMGDADADSFRAPPTSVIVGGTFEGEPGKGSWKYYLGKYEITRKQYKSIMGSVPNSQQTPQDDNLPVTNITYFDALIFCDKLNQWLYAHALKKMPHAGTYPGFVRLPLEVEWEFAVRGGLAVVASRFEASLPYTEPLQEHEWFAGAKSSHGKVRPVGKLKPNALGLHDMLGNVQEFTLSQYQLEYYQGRSGGFVSRGGSVLKAEGQLSSAQRQEEPYYRLDKGTLIPNQKSTLGLRLALSAPLLVDNAAIQALKDAWPGSRQGAGKQSPAALSVAPVSDQVAAKLDDAISRLERVRQDGDTKQFKKAMSYMYNALRSTQKIRDRADADTAKTLVFHADFMGQQLCQYQARRLILEERQHAAQREQQDAADTNLQKRLEDARSVVEQVLEIYRETIASLHKFSPELVQQAVKDRIAYHERIIAEQVRTGKPAADLETLMAVLGVVQKHYEQFAKDKKAHMDIWSKDFLSLAKHIVATLKENSQE